jgi:hypothetical protein
VPQNNFNEIIALFLAEVIRSRKTTIRRAAEIARRVVRELPKLQTEPVMLEYLTAIELDFEEVIILKEALRFGFEDTDVRAYEREVKDYAARLFQQDMVASTAFLQDAANSHITIQELCIKYPEFCRFLHQRFPERELQTV